MNHFIEFSSNTNDTKILLHISKIRNCGFARCRYRSKCNKVIESFKSYPSGFKSICKYQSRGTFKIPNKLDILKYMLDYP